MDQVSKQADAFAEKMRSEHESVRKTIGISSVTKASRVLDIACGPGLLAKAVAPYSGFVFCIDITRKMISIPASFWQAAARSIILRV